MCTFLILKKGGYCRGTWVAQSVKCPTLDFGSGRDFTVRGIEPPRPPPHWALRSRPGAHLEFSLSPPAPLLLSLPLKINKLTLTIFYKKNGGQCDYQMSECFWCTITESKKQSLQKCSLGNNSQAKWKSKNKKITDNLEKYIKEYSLRRQDFVGIIIHVYSLMTFR